LLFHLSISSEFNYLSCQLHENHQNHFLLNFSNHNQ
jgi:hypothetical protein